MALVGHYQKSLSVCRKAGVANSVGRVRPPGPRRGRVPGDPWPRVGSTQTSQMMSLGTKNEVGLEHRSLSPGGPCCHLRDQSSPSTSASLPPHLRPSAPASPDLPHPPPKSSSGARLPPSSTLLPCSLGLSRTPTCLAHPPCHLTPERAPPDPVPLSSKPQTAAGVLQVDLTARCTRAPKTPTVAAGKGVVILVGSLQIGAHCLAHSPGAPPR